MNRRAPTSYSLAASAIPRNFTESARIVMLKQWLRTHVRDPRTDAGPPAPVPVPATMKIEPAAKLDLKRKYESWVEHWKARAPHAEAMEMAIGGAFDIIGQIELELLQRYGLKPEHYLIDVGCGSGRLARPLSRYLTGRYLGFDLVADLVAHARQIANRPDWRFETIDHIGIPEKDGQADFVCFFSVLTHLLHEQSYWYLEEAKRVLKPGGKVAFSFLEFAAPGHWATFDSTLIDSKGLDEAPLNVFIERSVIQLWAPKLGFAVEAFVDGTEVVIEPSHGLGLTLCVLSKQA
ncbi:MAG: class I SAM-dependent methyltransferase [Rhodospirillaceae bacterium]|nr:class I SAM-dependent methyltransferase [Rhodospirillaceae bacterium]